MDEFIQEFRSYLRSALLAEDVHKHSIIALEADPGEKAQYDTYISIAGFDKAMSRGMGGFGGNTKANLAGQGDGFWKALNLPERTATGMQGEGVTPWVLFMDWLWDWLKQKGMSPQAYQGFGDIDTPYGQLSVAKKRQRKYGVQRTMDDPYDMSLDFAPKTKALKSQSTEFAKNPEKRTAHWPPGYDIKKDVTIIVDSLGTDPELVTKKFQTMLLQAKTPPWFHFAPVYGRTFVVINMDVDVPEGYKDRLETITAFKRENQEKWKNAIKKLAAGRTNPVQLQPVIVKYLVTKHGFKHPFNLDILKPEQLQQVFDIVARISLEELIQFAREQNMMVPVASAPEATKISTQIASMQKRWNEIVHKLAVEGSVEPLMVEVALTNWMIQNGFSDPFEFEMLPPAKQAKAVVLAGRLRFDDLRDEIVNVQEQIHRLDQHID